MATIIQIRRDTAANWTTNNPILADGEMGYETDTRKRKMGNGLSAWNILPYDSGYEAQGIINDAIVSGGTTYSSTKIEDELSVVHDELAAKIGNRLILGGSVTMAVDDDTALSVAIPETRYTIAGTEYTQTAGTFNLSLRPASGLSRIDVFYLDATGFHITTGAVSATPVKPAVLDGVLELSNMIIGFDNTLQTSDDIAVLGRKLNGLTDGDGTNLSTSDSILDAFGKVKKFFSDLLTTFNVAGKLVKMDADGKLPPLDGSKLTGVGSPLSFQNGLHARSDDPTKVELGGTFDHNITLTGVEQMNPMDNPVFTINGARGEKLQMGGELENVGLFSSVQGAASLGVGDGDTYTLTVNTAGVKYVDGLPNSPIWLITFLTGFLFSKWSGSIGLNIDSNSVPFLTFTKEVADVQKTMKIQSDLHTDDRTISLPDKSGTVALTSDVASRELASNKATDLTNPDDTKYPTTAAVDTAIKLSDNADFIGHIYMRLDGSPVGKFADEATLRNYMYTNVGGSTETILLKYNLHTYMWNTAYKELTLTVKLRYLEGTFDSTDRSAERRARQTSLNFSSFFSGVTNLLVLRMDFHPETMTNMLLGCTSLTEYINSNNNIIPYLLSHERSRLDSYSQMTGAYNTAGGTGGVQSYVTFCDPVAYIGGIDHIKQLFGTTMPTFPSIKAFTAGYIRRGLEEILSTSVSSADAIFNSISNDPTDLQDQLDLLAASIPSDAGNDIFNYYNFSTF